MSNELRPEESYVLSWSDLRVVLRRSKRKVCYGALVFALMAALFTLSRDIMYTAQGTFREKNKQNNSNEKTLSALLLSGGATAAESMAITTIKSRRVLERVAQDLGLQGKVEKKNNHFFLFQKAGHYLGNIYHNLVVEEAYLSKKYKPVVADPRDDLIVGSILYEEELPLSLELRFIDGEHFALYDAQGDLLSQASLGKIVKLGKASFVITKAPGVEALEGIYVLSIQPLHRVAQNQLAHLVVEADKLDKTLLKINYSDLDRVRSSQFLNTLMRAYREFLIDEHVRVTADQVAYLKLRQEDMDKQLVGLMEDHAVNISSNDASIEFLVKTQQAYKTKLLTIDLEMKHLEKAQEQGIAFFERYNADGDSPVVHNLLGEIRKYRQHADSLELALRDKHVYSPEKLQSVFTQYLEEWEEVQEANQEVRHLFAEVEKNPLQRPPASLLENPKYLIKPWHEKLLASGHQSYIAEDPAEKAQKEEEFSRCHTHFLTYLTNLLHLFEVQEKSIQDRLTYQQNPQQEFQGIDLETANGLYVTYSRELHSLEADLAQKEFVIQQLKQPEFEISSISTIMDDSVSRDIISKASHIMLLLKDEPNRTSKELDRLKRDVDIQKIFLIAHLKQMCDILQLREQLLEDKIYSLQNITLELTRQKISIQEKHLADFISSRLNNLKHEKYVITQHQEELQSELDLLPEKWASQKLIDQHMQSNLNIVHQIASMIESKTIAENLEVSQSAPFDEAVSPVLPRDPRLLLFAAIGGLGGAFLSFCFCIVQSASRGVEATKENLSLVHQVVAGSFSLPLDSGKLEGISADNRDVLRRLIVEVADTRQTAASYIGIIEGRGPHYASILAAFLAKSGGKVLLLPLSFEGKEASADDSPGLLDVLEGRAAEAKIIKGLSIDRMAVGGYSLFANELLTSEKFQKLLKDLSESYTWIIGYTNALPTSAEAEGLLKIFPRIAVTLSGERLEELAPYFSYSHQGSPIAFVFYDA